MITVFCSSIHALARRVHKNRLEQMYGWSMTLLLTGFLSLAGCIIPPDLEAKKEADGGVNRPPTIKWEWVWPKVGVKTSKDDPERFTIGFEEPDKQAVHVRMFVDGKYEKKIPISKERSAGGEVDGSVRFEVKGLCSVHLEGDTACSHMVEVYISDGGFVDETPGAKDLRLPKVGGLRDSVAWRWQCEK